jgi:cytochrome c biogenesis protein CcmG, thiol:disulfide interchange protein DsbE
VNAGVPQTRRFIGYVVDDAPYLALRWLERHGNPYVFSLMEATQQTPSTIPLTTTQQQILIDRNGVLQWRHLGLSTTGFLEEHLVPMLRAMEGGR